MSPKKKKIPSLLLVFPEWIKQDRRGSEKAACSTNFIGGFSVFFLSFFDLFFQFQVSIHDIRRDIQKKKREKPILTTHKHKN
ncbi:hypothetical protein BDV26DRAFT_265047 [Aspergillus bertholletiae]|uniref:Uncharacterized protein n=1 Tax=Aspergillus bertholletiae TaxID=1226010 RepID=A0A5N7B6A5_9EURO|nr:hypothetical protein BDV26DRAFT_265047 [Aspergillus bertholletiae]